ncbi:MAG: hypothetical protein EPN84_12840 [Legionella sp.]|nr:MAG: hypothetical protein EPN84_12840 [Legionella sp.]
MPHELDLIINANDITNKESEMPTQGMAILNLLSCLGYDYANLPAADLLRQSAHLDGDWLILSPVCWQATHNDAMIIAAGKDLELTDTQSRYWFKEYSEYLAEENIILYYFSPDLWLLRADHMAPIQAKPVYQLLQKSLMPELAALDESMRWQKLITESQMFFASLTPKTDINGIWVWGGAKLGLKKPLNICASEQFFDAASLCAEQVSLYQPEISLTKFQILIVESLEILSLEHQEELKQLDVQWYWNNTAYRTYPQHWMIRLWRNLTHAD